MAGMLPGVECARRRRLHQGSSSGGSMEQQSGSRRSSFCLYTTGYDSHLSTSFMQTRTLKKELREETLEGIAREAKERLDARLLGARNLSNVKSSVSLEKERKAVPGDNVLLREVFSSKKSRKKFSWGKVAWKGSEQVECAICLDEYKNGEVLVHLPCGHRFHGNCVVPWIENRSMCPCCRMAIIANPP